MTGTTAALEDGMNTNPDVLTGIALDWARSTTSRMAPGGDLHRSRAPRSPAWAVAQLPASQQACYSAPDADGFRTYMGAK